MLLAAATSRRRPRAPTGTRCFGCDHERALGSWRGSTPGIRARNSFTEFRKRFGAATEQAGTRRRRHPRSGEGQMSRSMSEANRWQRGRPPQGRRFRSPGLMGARIPPHRMAPASHGMSRRASGGASRPLRLRSSNGQQADAGAGVGQPRQHQGRQASDQQLAERLAGAEERRGEQRDPTPRGGLTPTSRVASCLVRPSWPPARPLPTCARRHPRGRRSSADPGSPACRPSRTSCRRSA